MYTVGERIKEKRIELGWSQQELAKKAGYSDKTAISKIEHAGNDITLKQVKRLAKALNADPMELMGWEHKDLDKIEVENDTSGDREGTLTEYQRAYAERLYELYLEANPDIKKAVDLLLKADKQP